MALRRTSRHTQASLFWALVTLSIGALAGIALAARYLTRKDRLQSDDPDAPLFI